MIFEAAGEGKEKKKKKRRRRRKREIKEASPWTLWEIDCAPGQAPRDMIGG